MHFAGKVALVTGGSSGIGLATARLLAASGSHVWLVARDEAKLEKALALVQADRANGQQRFGIISADVSDAGQAASAVVGVAEQAGTPDLLVNCAGFAHPGYFQELSLDIFRSTMNVDYFGTVNMAKAIAPGMIERGSGHIVNTCSMAGLLGVFGYTAYSAAKFAVRGFSDVLRAEMKPLGIKVSIVFPPNCDTPGLAHENQFKPPETKAIEGSARCLSPDAVARVILRGVSKGRYVIIPGFEGNLIYRLSGLVGGGMYPIMDYMVARARRGHSSDTI